jgi:UDP-N-acetylglucosamine 2-epimerase (non-hydrolysing)
MNVAIILGTRPEIIKLSPIIRELQSAPIPFFILHTGQHYSYALDRIFFEELNLPTPRYNLDVGSGSHAVQTARMLSGIEPILEHEKPAVVLVQGDTNSVLAGALAAVKLGLPVAHVEAGLRSHDRRMPEEINRILTDQMSRLLFAPTDIAVQNLLDEGIGAQPFVTAEGEATAAIYNVGNSIVDATRQNIQIAREQETGLLKQFGLAPKNYVLLTAHRSENVDNPEFLHHLCQLMDYVRETYHLRLIWPVHPRAAKQLNEFGLTPSATLIEPQSYLKFLSLAANAKLIITDSGGVQEEACVLGVPCVTVRKTTDRPETLLVGAGELGYTTLETMKIAVDHMINHSRTWDVPYAPDTSRAVVRILSETIHQPVEFIPPVGVTEKVERVAACAL